MPHSAEFPSEITSLAHYKNHLEFLGYQICKEEKNRIWAKHSRKVTLEIIDCGNLGIIGQIVFPLHKEKGNYLELLEWSNRLNYFFNFLKACVITYENQERYLFLNSFLEGTYDRKNFSIFLDNIEEDIKKFFEIPLKQELYQKTLEQKTELEITADAVYYINNKEDFQGFLNYMANGIESQAYINKKRKDAMLSASHILRELFNDGDIDDAFTYINEPEYYPNFSQAD